jgi:hypothetical protein
MSRNPELEEFRQQINGLRDHPTLKPRISGGEVRLAELELKEVDELIRTSDAAYYFLIAAGGLNRTSVKKAMREPDAQINAPRLRKAFVIKQRLPVRASFQATAVTAIALRESDLTRKRGGGVEQLFRERLKEEGIPVLMSPPPRFVPGLLVGKRKPDGVYPDPATGQPPRLYLEVKNVRRVSDDIQKRLYEIAEASLEMKAIYGNLKLEGLAVESTLGVECDPALRARLRGQVTTSAPVVVALLICPRAEAERYRPGLETFVDRVFFQEEIEECLGFLKATIESLERGDGR